MERQFSVEHLASFPQEAGGHLTPSDAIEKLKRISSGGGLWAQEMIMKITPTSLIMVNGKTTETIEEYPHGQISSCVSVLDDKIFENLLVFGTKLSKDKVGAVHLFQCQPNQADAISEVINGEREFRTSQLNPSVPLVNGDAHLVTNGSSSIVESSITPAAVEPRKPLSLQQKHAVARAVEAFQQPVVEPQPVKDQGKLKADMNGNLSPLQDARINRDVEILNKCIEEVENFVVHLKRINEARRQLQTKKISKKKKQHDILLLQAQPPSEATVYDIYQKFKHSFNLLAKLRPHISAPNAPELIHYLIIPLSIIVKVTGIDKARAVLEPLLTQMCVDLLRSCLDSREYHFWQTLGPNWTLTKASEHFNGKTIPPYSPVFSDGWIPPEIVLNEQQEAAARSTAAMVARMKNDGDDMRNGNVTADTNSVQRSNSFSQQPPQLIGIVVYDYIAHNNKELTIRAGEKVIILDNSRRWWLVRNDHGEQGYVPSTVLEVVETAASDAGGRDSMDGNSIQLQDQSAPMYSKVNKTTTYPNQSTALTQNHVQSTSYQSSNQHSGPHSNYMNGTALNTTSSAFKPPNHRGTPVIISVQLPDGLTTEVTPRTTVDASGQQRHIVQIPAAVSQPQVATPPEQRVKTHVTQTTTKTVEKHYRQPSPVPPPAPAPVQVPVQAPAPPPPTFMPPPPPPPPPPAVAPPAPNYTIQKATTATAPKPPKADLHSELRSKFSKVEVGAGVEEPIADIDAVDVFIPLYKSSTADDVSRWLEKLGFSDRTIDILRGKTAKDLFKMTKDNLITELDHDEGVQLYMELQVQNGALTRHKTMTEFQKALVKRLQKREEQQELAKEASKPASRKPESATFSSFAAVS